MYVGRTSAQATVDALVTELSSLNTDNRADTMNEETSKENVADYFSNAFSALMPVQRNGPTIGRGHLALILLAELSYEVGTEFRQHLPVILQLVFLGFDNPQPPVYEHSRILLLNLVHSLVVEPADLADLSTAAHAEALDLVDFLKSKESKPLWANEGNS
jgi:hypothetical protein